MKPDFIIETEWIEWNRTWSMKLNETGFNQWNRSHINDTWFNSQNRMLSINPGFHQIKWLRSSQMHKEDIFDAHVIVKAFERYFCYNHLRVPSACVLPIDFKGQRTSMKSFEFPPFAVQTPNGNCPNKSRINILQQWWSLSFSVKCCFCRPTENFTDNNSLKAWKTWIGVISKLLSRPMFQTYG